MMLGLYAYLKFLNFSYFFLKYFSVKMMEGIIATSYAAGDKFYIDPAKLLPLSRFLPQPKFASSSFLVVLQSFFIIVFS